MSTPNIKVDAAKEDFIIPISKLELNLLVSRFFNTFYNVWWIYTFGSNSTLKMVSPGDVTDNPCVAFYWLGCD